jgi:hypothetical protein
MPVLVLQPGQEADPQLRSQQEASIKSLGAAVVDLTAAYYAR